MLNYELLNDDTSLMYSGIERVFANRGISDPYHYLNTSKKDELDPLELSNLKEGVELLLGTIANNGKVVVNVDCDADGWCSAALLMNFLHELFPNWAKSNLKYIHHSAKQHGLSDQVDTLLAIAPDLVICPDSSSNDGEYGEKLEEKEIKVLAIDHHHCLPEETEPIVMVSNQLGYPNPTLSGVGVVYKFCQYVEQLAGRHKTEHFLDLVAVGMTADLMELTQYETVYYIQEGMKNFNNPFLAAMALQQDYSIGKNGGLCPYTIGFFIAPFINAVVRSGSYEEKRLVFDAFLECNRDKMVPSGRKGHKGELDLLVNEAVRTAMLVKNHQTKDRDAALEIIENLIAEQFNGFDSKVLAVKIPRDKGINKNVLGLVANILVNKYQQPIILLNEGEDEWAGSFRDYSYSPIEDFRLLVEGMPRVLFSAGHAAAGGCGIEKNGYDEFLNAVNDYLKDVEFTPSYKVDFILKENFKISLAEDICELAPYYGSGFTEPKVAVEKVELRKDNCFLMARDKNPTLKVSLANGAEVIIFKFNPETYDAMFANSSKKTYLTVVGTFGENFWNGTTTYQVKVEDYEMKTEYSF